MTIEELKVRILLAFPTAEITRTDDVLCVMFNGPLTEGIGRFEVLGFHASVGAGEGLIEPIDRGWGSRFDGDPDYARRTIAELVLGPSAHEVMAARRRLMRGGDAH